MKLRETSVMLFENSTNKLYAVIEKLNLTLWSLKKNKNKKENRGVMGAIFFTDGRGVGGREQKIYGSEGIQAVLVFPSVKYRLEAT
jgi:hypothetical protein